jgi:hypothetical protein
VVTFEWFGPDEQLISSNNEMNIIIEQTESILQFNVLKQSYNGTYKCRVTVGTTSSNATRTVSVSGKWINIIVLTMTFHKYHAAPNIGVTISMGNVILGQDHVLTCNASGAEKLNPSINYQWTKMNDTGTFTEVGTNSTTFKLSLSPLYLSDAGSYICNVTITSQEFLTGSITEQSTIKLQIDSELINFNHIIL